MIPQSLFLCSDRVGMSPFVTNSLSFLGGGLGFDDKEGFSRALDVD